MEKNLILGLKGLSNIRGLRKNAPLYEHSQLRINISLGFSKSLEFTPAPTITIQMLVVEGLFHFIRILPFQCHV